MSRCLFAVFLLVSTSLFAQTSSMSEHDKLNNTINDEWQFELRTNPEFATHLGDPRYNAEVSDLSAAAIAKTLAMEKQFLAQLEALNAGGLSSDDQLNRTLLMQRLQNRVDEARFKPWEMPIDQMNGIHSHWAQIASATSFNNRKDYDDYVARLSKFPRLVDQVIANMQQGVRDRLVPPQFLMQQVVVQLKPIAEGPAEKTPFASPLNRFPSSIDAAEQQQIRKLVLAAITTGVMPAYAKLMKYVQDDYAPKCRKEIGVWALPDGKERYQFLARKQTTTDLSPDAIHKMGEEQVALIAEQMLAIAKKMGFPDPKSFNAHIRTDRALYATSGEQILGKYQQWTDQMYGKLPQLFSRLPKNKLSVVPMEMFRAPSAVPADYSSGSPESGRPGRINVNEYAAKDRLLLNAEAIAYHEGVPGHHLQISLAQEQIAIPPFRRYAGYTAFVEGWALYAERLAKEVGFYEDPYSEYGRLGNEMWRAIRLVVDTGVHWKHWSRDQMVELFRNYTAMDEPNIQTEVDRYIADPGQALAYKIGQMKILALREQARNELGARFDVRDFHDAVLARGALPLDELQKSVDGYIAKTKSPAQATGN
jgi:uncharacterized protein (DUF885 family)